MRYTECSLCSSVDLGPDTIVCDTNNFMLDAVIFASYNVGALVALKT